MGELFRPRYSARPGATPDPVRMAERILAFDPATDAEAAKLVRAAYAGYPLSARLTALHLMMRRQPSPPQRPR